MKLGINAVGLYPGKIGGAEQYLRNIVKKLDEYSDIETVLFLNDTAIFTFEENPRLKTVCVDINYNHIAQLKNYIAYYQIEVWFCPLFHLIPLDCGIPNVTAIFDIQQDYFPENFDPFVLEQRRKLTQDTVAKTDMVLTISDFSKQTLMEKYQMDPDKIKVTYLDADASFDLPILPGKLQQVRETLPEEFILFPANMWPHKNHINLLSGFATAKEKYGLNLKLVFTGSQERETAAIEAVIEERGLRDDIKYLGYLPQDDMRYVFACANMLAFPSLFEGFGIPLVEAMSVGVPIICSNSSCVPEIAGDAAVIFDGKKPDEIAEAIYKVYKDKELRARLVENGKKRRNLFSWDACTKDTVEYLRQLYKPLSKYKQKLSDHPKVSIITPSYNQGCFIRETVESVLNQTYDNIEYIVMDGGSKDETVEILKSYGDRIKWVSEKDGGQADAVNKGIAVAQGEIIGWLNSDDTYYPNAVEKAVRALQNHPQYDMIYGEGDYIDLESRVTSRYNTKAYDFQELASECIICQPTAFFTKAIVEKVGLLNAHLQLCMDYELWMRIGKEGKILYIPEKMATSRMYEDNKTLSRRSEVYKECCMCLKEHYGYVPHNWLVGYAAYIAEKYKKIKRKYLYFMLFLRYNWKRPDYFMTCLKGYLRLRKRNGAAAPQPGSVPANGRYIDGWLGESYAERMICVGDENEIVIEGRHLLPFDKPMILTVCADQVSKNFVIEDIGAFTCVLPLPEEERTECKVKITASQTCVPANINGSGDQRHLSVMLDSIVLRKRDTKHKPLVSIITPSYNQGEFLKATIESVLSQDYENIEYIVVDGGSTDNSLELLESYKGRLEYISEPDNGQSDAINKGFAMAKGEIIAWLNSDDVYESGCVSKAVEAFNRNPQAALVYGDGYIIDRAGEKLRPFEFSRSFSLWSLIHIWDYIMQPATFFRANAVKKLGGLDVNKNWIMDWDLWVKLALRYDVEYIHDFLACSREYGDTKTSTGMQKRLDEILHFMQQNTGEENPFGYEIYYCSELLANYKLEDARRNEVTNRLAYLLNFQPVPDSEGRCMNVANFMLRPYECAQALELYVDEPHVVSVRIYFNNELLCAHELTAGDTTIPLPQTASKTVTYIRIESDAEDLKHIGQQKDSWLRAQLKK